jgi:integrase
VVKGLGLAPAAAPATKGKANTISTEAQAKNALPGVYAVKGAPRLILKKTTAATGSWVVRFRYGDKRPEMGLGSMSTVSLEEARGKAAEADVALRHGLNPLAERDRISAAMKQAREEEERASARPTVAALVDTYLADNAPQWKHVYARANWFNPIKRYAYPIIEKLKVNEVTSQHILAVVRAADERGRAVLGKKVRSRLKTAFDYAITHGHRDAALGNPAEASLINGGRKAKGRTMTEHYRRIELDDAPAAFAKLYGLASDNTAIAAWVFMALTAARPGEALAATWDQIDLDAKVGPVWRNPTSKTGAGLVVPLSSAAIAILGQAKARRVSDRVFANTNGGRMAHSGFGTAPKRNGIDAGSPHSWRSIFRDAAEDKLGFSDKTAEAALGHSLGSVERAYRRETGIEKRTQLMEAYSGWLLATEAADKVVSIATKRA